MSVSSYREFVPDDELYELTGYKRASEQERVLRAMGLKPFPGRNGVPKVTWEAVNRIMENAHSATRRGAEPDWSAMDGP